MILVGGVLLLAPGYLTDAAGFSLLIPWTRSLYRGAFLRWLRRKLERGEIILRSPGGRFGSRGSVLARRGAGDRRHPRGQAAQVRDGDPGWCVSAAGVSRAGEWRTACGQADRTTAGRAGGRQTEDSPCGGPGVGLPSRPLGRPHVARESGRGPRRPRRLRFPSIPFREERKSHVVATVEQLAALVRGRLVGDGSVSIHSARPVGEAGPGDITFIENERYAKLLRTSPASAAIVGPALQARRRPTGRCRSSRSTTRSPAFLAVRTPPAAAAEKPRWTGVHPQAWVAPTATIGADVAIYPFAYVGDDAVVGDGATLHPGRRRRRRLPARARGHAPPQRRALSRRSCSGDRVEVHAGTVLGGDGFGYRLVDGRHVKIPQTGRRRGRRRRRDRRQLHDRPRDLRGDPDRRGDEDRQPRHDRPQQPDRPPQPALRPGRHRRQLQDRRLRRHGRPGRDQGQHRDRRPGRSSAPRPGSTATSPAASRSSARRPSPSASSAGSSR